MKHLITIEIPNAPHERGAIAQLRRLGAEGRLGEFVTDIKSIPESAPTTTSSNPLLRRKPKQS